MTKDITPQAPKDIQQPGFDVLSPLASQALFWRARYSAPSPVLTHLPLLFWLCETIRPRVTLTLGVADAVPHFALCQAVETLGLESLCFGVEPAAAPGAPRDGEEETDMPAPADLSGIRAFNDHNFSDFSLIQQQSGDQGPALPPECKIDFLVINQPASQTLFDSLEATWLPLMSERGVVVFLQGGQIAGYDSYLRRLSQSDGVYVIDPETRASLVLTGPDQNDRLERLVQLRIGQPGYLAARRVFTRLGEIHSKSSRLDEARKEAETTAETQAENARLAEKISELETQIATLSEQLKDRSAKVATAQAEAFDAQQANTQWQDKAKTAQASLEDVTRELEQARAENATHTAALQTLQQQLADRATEAKAAAENATLLNTELAETRTRLNSSDAEQQKLQSMVLKQEKDLGERFDDIATLGLEIHEQEQGRKAAQDEIEHLKHQLGEAERARDERAHRVAALEDSTSWRITAPLRKVTSTLRR